MSPDFLQLIVARLDSIDARLDSLTRTLDSSLLPTPRPAPAPADSDPWLTRVQAAHYLNFSPSSFERARRQFPQSLKPCVEHPIRWSRNALDAFKLTRGASLKSRPGRRRLVTL